jgi:hypothetical protein
VSAYLCGVRLLTALRESRYGACRRCWLHGVRLRPDSNTACLSLRLQVIVAATPVARRATSPAVAEVGLRNAG